MRSSSDPGPGVGPGLSFVIIAYNEAANIGRTLDAIGALSGLGDYEVIVVDDGSRDGTPDIVRQRAAADPHVRLIGLPANRGRGYARSTGIAAASGELIATVDADILLPGDWYVRAQAALSGHDAVGGNRRAGRRRGPRLPGDPADTTDRRPHHHGDRQQRALPAAGIRPGRLRPGTARRRGRRAEPRDRPAPAVLRDGAGAAGRAHREQVLRRVAALAVHLGPGRDQAAAHLPASTGSRPGGGRFRGRHGGGHRAGGHRQPGRAGHPSRPVARDQCPACPQPVRDAAATVALSKRRGRH